MEGEAPAARNAQFSKAEVRLLLSFIGAAIVFA